MAKLIKSSLGEMTADIIRERIIDNEYPSGMRIREDELSREFDISRICVREALLILERENLLERGGNKPCCVRRFTEKNVMDLLKFRSTLETAAATECIKADHIPEKELKTCISRMRMLHERDASSKEYLEADIAFHDTLIRSLDNDYFNLSWDTVRSQYLMLMHALYKVRSDEFSSGFAAHLRIAELIFSKETGEAVKFIERHVLSNFDSISALIRE